MLEHPVLAVEDVVDRGRVDEKVAPVAVQHRGEHVAVVLAVVTKHDVVSIGDEDVQMPGLAFATVGERPQRPRCLVGLALRRSDRGARCIGRDDERMRTPLGERRVDDGGAEGVRRLEPAAQRRLR